MQIVVESNARDVADWLLRLGRDQIPYATSLAINNVAKSAQRAQVAGMHERFTIRRPSFARRTVKIKPFATKRSLEAVLWIDPPGDTSDIWAKFEMGGVKQPRGTAIAVPEEARRTKTGVITKRQRPKAFEFRRWGRGAKGAVYRGERRTWMVRTPEGEGAIFQRVGRGPGSSLRMLYSFARSAEIDERLQFEETVERTVDGEWERHFSEAFARAMGTAR